MVKAIDMNITGVTKRNFFHPQKENETGLWVDNVNFSLSEFPPFMDIETVGVRKSSLFCTTND